MAKITKIKGYPVFAANIEDANCGMVRVSLVDAPAVKRDFIHFAEEQLEPERKTAGRYAVQNEEQRLVRGVIMRADVPILRYDKEFGYYWIVFEPDTIRDMAERYLAEGRQNAVDLQHDGDEVEGVQLVQWFIKDSAAGIDPEGFEDVEDGSLFGEYHVLNDDVWEAIKKGEYKGFSIEVIANELPVTGVVSTEKMGKISIFKNMSKKTIMGKVRVAIAAALESVENAPAQENFGSVSTDRGVLLWDGDEALKVGDRVRIADEDGNESDAPDGDYKTENKVVTVSGGEVTTIADLEDAAAVAEPAQGEPTKATGFAAIIEKLSASFDDKYRAIYDALWDLGVDGYIISAGDDFALVATYNDRYYRYGVTFEADGYKCTLDGGVEVFPVWATAEERDAIEQKYAAVAAERDALKEELAALRNTPADAPAHDEDKAATAAADNKFARVKRILG